MSYPRHLFKSPGPHGLAPKTYHVAGAADKAEERRLIEQGWHLTKEAAWGLEPVEAQVAEEPEPEPDVEAVEPEPVEDPAEEAEAEVAEEPEPEQVPEEAPAEEPTQDPLDHDGDGEKGGIAASILDPASAEDIVSAIDLLEAANDEHWTTAGLPSVGALSGLLEGKSVTRAAITAAAPEARRPAAGE